MLTMSGFGSLFTAVGNLYLLLAAISIGVALWKGKSWLRKVLYASLVLAFFIAPIAPGVYRGIEYRSKLATAQSAFEARCRIAGEKIYRTVDNVDGVLLMKIRPDKVNFSEQYAMDDPYGRDLGSQGYIGSFLRSTEGEALNPRVAEGRRLGFSYVEVIDLTENRRYRYKGVIKSMDGRDANFELERAEATHPSALYGVTYADISTNEDRENWIAGGLLQVLDLRTDAVVAQRTGYIFDQALGDTSGGRGPWEAAQACPGAERKYGHNARFVFKALNPKGEK